MKRMHKLTINGYINTLTEDSPTPKTAILKYSIREDRGFISSILRNVPLANCKEYMTGEAYINS